MPERVVARRFAIALLSVIVVWQLYVVVVILLRAATFLEIFTGLGAVLPPLTRLFFITYRFWIAVPLVFAGFLIDLARRNDAPVRYAALLVAVALAVSFVMHAVATEALYAPLFSLIKSL